jgi:hypothetical protein
MDVKKINKHINVIKEINILNISNVYSKAVVNFNVKLDPFQYYMSEFDVVKIPNDLVDDFYNYFYKRCINASITMYKNEITQSINNLSQYCRDNIKNSRCLEKQLQEVDIDDVKAITFNVNNHIPFVMRNANKYTCETQNFIKKYGNEHVIFIKTKTKEHYYDELKTINNSNDYVGNCNTILDNNPEIVSKLIKPFKNINGITYNDSSQIFISTVKGNGTEMHAAWSTNFFFQIDGEKKWTFVHPNNSHFVYPLLSETGIYYSSYTKTFDLKDKSHNFELLKYCPRYSVILKPGDVLFNPGMWWHGVKNISKNSIGIATRWGHNNYPLKSKLFLSTLGNDNIIKLSKDNLKKYGETRLSIMDEHTEINGKSVRVSALEQMNTGRELVLKVNKIFGKFT